LARNLCLANAKVVLEDLNVSGLVRNHKLAKSISEQRDVNAAKVIFKNVVRAKARQCIAGGNPQPQEVGAPKPPVVAPAARGGHPQSNASRDVPSTSVGRKSSKSKERQ
jgi:putative transposase